MDIMTSRRRLLALGSALATGMLSLVVLTGPANATAEPPAAPSAVVDSGLRSQLQAGGSADFLVYLRTVPDLTTAAKLPDRVARTTAVYQKLTANAEASQRALRSDLTARGVAYRPFWITNAVLVTGDRELLEALATRGDIARIEPVRWYPVTAPTVTPDDSQVATVEWNLTNIEAPRVWSEFSVRGEGIVVANIDTGVQYNHPALVRQYRGNLGNGTFNHNYNWFDPARVCGNPSLIPCDNNSHGTHVMGTIVGDDGATNQIGVAPGAKWIAAKGCEGQFCSNTSLLAAGQWVLAPTDLNGANPRPDLRPDIVNNSWGGGRGSTWYQQTIQAWVAAGIFPAFAAGNSGSACNTANSPGDNPEAYAVGAYDINNAIAWFSSRGVSGVDGAIKPNIAAPGVAVRSSVPTNAYGNNDGTSMATPHVSGTVALMWSAAPTLRGNIAQTRAVLDATATDVNSTGCGGTVAKNNNFGEGRLNAYQAVLNSPRGQNCFINVAGGTHTCTGVPGISVQSLSGGRLLLKLTFTTGQTAKLAATYSGTPSGFTVNIGDSSTNDGGGGDAGTQSNDAEMMLQNQTQSVFGRDGVPTYPLLTVPNAALGAGKVANFEVADRKLCWSFGAFTCATSEWLYALNGQNDPEGLENYDIYAAFNRVITGRSDRNGTGVSTVSVSLS